MSTSVATTSGNGVDGRKCLVILGMHRSGTSALSRVLNLLGATLPQELVPAEASNPRGHWEPAHIVELNEALLTEIGGGWDNVAPIAWQDIDSAWRQSAVARIRSALIENYGDARMLLVKDPRIGRLVPLWQEALASLEIEPCFIITYRDPFEIVSSLARRDGMTRQYAYTLYGRYTLDALSHTETGSRTGVAYDDLLTNWRTVTGHIARRFGVQWSSAADEEIDGFLSSELRNERSSSNEFHRDNAVLPVVRQISDLHLSQLRGDDFPVEAILRLGQMLDEASSDAGMLRSELQARSARTALQRQKELELRNYIALVQPEVETLRATVAHQEAQSAPERDRRLSIVENLLADSAQDIQDLKEMVSSLATATTHLASRETAAQEDNRTLARSRDELSSTKAELHEAQRIAQECRSVAAALDLRYQSCVQQYDSARAALSAAEAASEAQRDENNRLAALLVEARQQLDHNTTALEQALSDRKLATEQRAAAELRLENLAADRERNSQHSSALDREPGFGAHTAWNQFGRP